MTDSPDVAFDLLSTQLLNDPDLDVSLTATGLHVRGRLFAYLDDDALVADLPRARAVDLVGRGVASAAPRAGPSRRATGSPSPTPRTGRNSPPRPTSSSASRRSGWTPEAR